jgi:hypothetical protein
MLQDGLSTENATARRAQTYATPLVHVDPQGRIHTLIRVERVDAEIVAMLTAHQVDIVRADADGQYLETWIPFTRLDSVAALPVVRTLRPPHYASRR